jgi:hypothetical protein
LPLFLADHTWEKKNTTVVTSAIIGSFMELSAGKRPKGWSETACLCASYQLPGERAICIWEADKAETLEKMFKSLKDAFPAETKIIPLVQVYPPGPGLYELMAKMAK